MKSDHYRIINTKRESSLHVVVVSLEIESCLHFFKIITACQYKFRPPIRCSETQALAALSLSERSEYTMPVILLGRDS